MPIPSTISDLNTSAALNSPAGSESPTQGDDYLRAIQAIIKTLDNDRLLIISNQADASSASLGAGLSGFSWALNYAANTAGWGVRTAAGLQNALRWMPVSEWLNILNGTTTTDLTTYIQTALDSGEGIYFPRGKWPISATTGLVPPSGRVIRGAGHNQTLFWGILGTGGSSAQIVAYTAGSLFRRQFNVSPGVNSYVQGWDIDDVGIILNHPTASITTTALQIGIDLRNVTRSRIGKNVYVGNYTPPGSFVTRSDPPSGYAQQGYGIVIGNVASGLSSYCGGEGNCIHARVWGAYKLIVQDDAALSPSSAAHDTIVAFSDMQGGHHQLVQESQYTSGCTWFKNTVQFCIKQTGDASASYAFKFTGYDSYMGGGSYAEMGANTDNLLSLASSSHGCDFTLGGYSGSAGCAISDAGTNNELNYRESTATLPAVNSEGRVINLFARAFRRGFAKGTISAGVATITDSFGVTSFTQVVAGRWKLVLSKAMPNINWVADLRPAFTSGNSGNAMPIRASQSTTDFQWFTYTQVAGVTTQTDPVDFYIEFSQGF